MRRHFPLFLLSLLFSFSIELVAQGGFNVDSIGKYEFPNPIGVNTNEVWGYVDSNGTEYALVGRFTGFSVISLADPTNPVPVYNDTSAFSLWRDMKTWAGYAYVVNEDRGGMEIYDLRALPDSVRKVGAFTADSSAPLVRAHNLWIDSNGVAYLFGTNNQLPVSAGSLFLDLATDPENPIILGNYDSLYLHDGYVRDDILYAGAVFAGKLLVLDVSDKANPVLLGSAESPTTFTHNTWLSDDGNTVFTTDEVSGGYIGAFDVSNPANPFEIDRIRSRNTTDVIPHNTHVLNDFLVTSYYTSGVSIIDASNPENLVEVGYFDTSPNFSGDGFNGNWGAYPFLPSGLLLATDMEEGLLVLRPNYTRASFLEVFVNDCRGNRITQAEVRIDTIETQLTNLIGSAKFGNTLDGYFPLSVRAKGFDSLMIDSVRFSPGVTNRISILLQDTLTDIQIRVVDNEQNRLGNAKLSIFADDSTISLSTNVFGESNVTGLDYSSYKLNIGAWAFETRCQDSIDFQCTGDIETILLNRKYEDIFELDLGWTVSGNDSSGAWTIADPIGTIDINRVANPAQDAITDCGEMAYVTGNAQGNPDLADVDSTTILRSPVLLLDDYIDPYLVFSTWFYSNSINPIEDHMLVNLIDTAGNKITIDTITIQNVVVDWQLNNIKISSFIDPNIVRNVEFVVSDNGDQSIVEAGLDDFFVSEGQFIGLEERKAEESLSLYPNPFSESVVIKSEDQLIHSYQLYDQNMRLLRSGMVDKKQFELTFSDKSSNGLYFIRMELNNGKVMTKKLVKY